VPGNLPRQATSFVGREVEVKELAELVRTHELVTSDRCRRGRQDPVGGTGGCGVGTRFR
jgi:hypothetical protein